MTATTAIHAAPAAAGRRAWRAAAWVRAATTSAATPSHTGQRTRRAASASEAAAGTSAGAGAGTQDVPRPDQLGHEPRRGEQHRAEGERRAVLPAPPQQRAAGEQEG